MLGGGVAGTNAALIAAGMGADVAVVDRNPEALRRIAAQFGSRVRTLFSTRDVVETLCRRADLVIATVLVPGATAPKLITAETVKAMKPGSVIVDVAIDQGGCAETSRPTTHSHPTYVVDDVVHYCVTNMPGAVARTSTFALSNMTHVVRAGARRQGLAARAQRGRASAQRPQRARRPGHLSRRRRCLEAAVHAMPSTRCGFDRLFRGGAAVATWPRRKWRCHAHARARSRDAGRCARGGGRWRCMALGGIAAPLSGPMSRRTARRRSTPNWCSRSTSPIRWIPRSRRCSAKATSRRITSREFMQALQGRRQRQASPITYFEWANAGDQQHHRAVAADRRAGGGRRGGRRDRARALSARRRAPRFPAR